ncbi:hypothetical protein KSP40_PGU005333 [Platanthera guangdongensis]|uniref:Chlorophyll a-b binding protein, chloroplastic n=1 Tax=Platanthera guangdongensis TaxID=2320717 RepID=A0ABR2MYJ5_9ASPA
MQSIMSSSTSSAGVTCAPSSFPCTSTSYGARRSHRHRYLLLIQPFPPSWPSSSSRLNAGATRATWLPGLDPPPHLDGSLVGDFGFDPLGLGEDPESLRWYVQAELLNSRFAMVGVAGILVTDVWADLAPDTVGHVPGHKYRAKTESLRLAPAVVRTEEG